MRRGKRDRSRVICKTDKQDCFAYKYNERGKASCTALIMLNCEGCKFYKNRDKYLDELKKCDERNRRNGIIKITGRS